MTFSFFLSWKVLTNLSSWAFESPFKCCPFLSPVKIFPLAVVLMLYLWFSSGHSQYDTNSYSQIWGLSFFPRPLWQCPKSSVAFHSEQQITVLLRRVASSPYTGEPDQHSSRGFWTDIFPLRKDAFIFTVLTLSSKQTAFFFFNNLT